ncbi:AraC family transcriptional regulator [Leptothoe sp. ISB3NOV94-8A]|uniref:AraC family transcriptional regulator n=1 Tax=Adonisia turfae CCMR0081 TaxID=2292702 RepID=A0A6M0RF25_9CYAN|nr:AraC family transcriptional regulator [Adonisia turfae]MDV3348713.1 AraC family transcriptional regulator [Leptothoe sp. LEGE 181152]NEZ54510.1 AraC family transcriptional regulator [Adonisia turfae CCMR0081]
MSTQTDSARLWKTDLPGVELFEAQLHQHRFGKHFHEAYTIGFNESGQGCCLHHGENRILGSGSFNLINPGDIHTGQVASTEGWGFRNIYVEFSQIEQLLTQLDWPGHDIPYFKAPIVKAPSVQPIFYELFHCLTTPSSQLKQQSLLLELLSKLFQLNAENSFIVRPVQPESTAVAHVRTYLEAHYADNVSLDKLAQLVNLSSYYLIRCFRQQVGCAPHQYQRHWRLIQAKRALRNGGSLTEIATDHGFYDQSHLNRAFKKTYGVTPGQYQKGNSVQYGWG